MSSKNIEDVTSCSNENTSKFEDKNSKNLEVGNYTVLTKPETESSCAVPDEKKITLGDTITSNSNKENTESLAEQISDCDLLKELETESTCDVLGDTNITKAVDETDTPNMNNKNNTQQIFNCDLLKKLEPKSSCAVANETIITKAVADTVDNKSLTENIPVCTMKNVEESVPDGLNDDVSNDTQEEEIVLRWDDDENSNELGEKFEFDKNKFDDISKSVDLLKAKQDDTECSKKVQIETSGSRSITSLSESFSITPIKNDHGINKPDVMLDIPGMLPDIDEELESMNLDTSSDIEKESNPEETDMSFSDLLSKVNAVEEGELVCKLEMSSDNEDDSPENTLNSNKADLAEAIANEVKLLSNTMSSIEEQHCIVSKSADGLDITIEPSTEKLNLIESITHKVESLAGTISNIKRDETLQDIPITISECSAKHLTITEEINALKPQATPSEQREKDMNLKVSTLISTIEEEMQLLDSNDETEMETFEVDSKKSNFNKKNNKETVVLSKDIHIVKEIVTDIKDIKEDDLSSSDPKIIKVTQISTEVDADLNAAEEISAISEIEPKKKELNESELRQKEEDEIALAVKAIEQTNEIYELAPAVTLVNVNNAADELSEISVLDEDDQASISLVLDDDDDENIEVMQQTIDPASVPLDESEVSIIHDSEEDESPISVSDADNISTENATRNKAQSTETQEECNKELQRITDVQNNVTTTEIHEFMTSGIHEEAKGLSLIAVTKKTELTTVESENIKLNISVQKVIENDQDVLLGISSYTKQKAEILAENRITIIETSKEKLGHNLNVDNEPLDQVEKGVKEITSIDSMKDETTKCLENVSFELSTSLQDVPNILPNSEQEKAITGIEQKQDSSLTLHPDLEDIEPHPSTSTANLDLNKDSSNDIPDSDTLGLLAESTRVIDDDDDEDDDDDDFYHDDESNLMTAEHSEDSNHQSDDGQEAQDIVETEEKEITKQVEMDSTNVSIVGDQDYNDKELNTPEQQEKEFQFTISNITNNVQKSNNATEAVMDCDIQLDAETVEPCELSIDDKKDPEPIEVEKPVADDVKTPDATDNAVDKTATSDEPASKPEVKENKSPQKMLSLTISSQQTVWNFVDLEESSEDEIQVVQKPIEDSSAAKQPEQIPELIESEAQKMADKETLVEQPQIISTPGSESDVEMGVEVLDEELLRIDDLKDTDEAAEKTPIQEEKCTNDLQKQPEKMDGVEVFNLDSDDEEPTVPAAPVEEPPSQSEPESALEPPKRDLKCINSKCQYLPDAQFFMADSATVNFYDGDKRRRAFVCEHCWQPVQQRNEELMDGIRNLTPLLELDMNTISLDLVEISDSDSEGEPEGEELEKEKIGDAAAKFLEEHLADVLNETWVKYQMDSRLTDTESVLQMELRRLETESKEINSFLNECQATTDRIRNELYASFPQEIKQVPPLVVYDTPEQQYCYVQSLVPQTKEGETPTPIPTRMSKRRLEANANLETPAKRPAIPLGYTPLESQDKGKTSTTGIAAVDKSDDDNMEVSVVNIISSEAAPPGLPPPGDLVRPPLRVGMAVYAMRNSFSSWVKGKILEIMPKGTQSVSFTSCKVKFDNKVTKTPVKSVLGRCIAYAEPSAVRLTIGTRVIANFKDTRDNKELPQVDVKRESYFSGVVAEVPNPVNNYRYLIFFDDGYAQYATHAETRLVCECASLVWEEVHPFSREFVREYLLAYPERPMVRLHPDQSLKTEWNGKWWSSRIVSVDASLAQVHFLANNRYEWIYRGSTRLAPLFLELQAAERHRSRPMPRTQAHSRANMPVVEYTRYDEQSKTFEEDKTPQQQRQEAEAIRQRAVAKKSTGGAAVLPQSGPLNRVPPGHNLDNVTSRVVYYTPKNAVKPHKMVPHTCGPKCKRTDVLALKDLRTYNPLAKPLLSGWERQIVRYKGGKVVVYRAPCGRRVRGLRELHRYLRLTRADLPVDLFDFSPTTHCLAEFVLNKCLIMKKDLSQGKENVPVPCVNYYDETLPEFCLYNTERTPTAGVPLNLDPEFLCGCDCEDDCEDKSKCACWKLTLEGARTIGLEGDNVGYVYKRLPEPLPSGIYECNSRCKCKHTCLNRVAQHPLQLKLQIFKTLNRGWGIRALNDVPKGSFLCVYAGNLLTDATANLDGLNEGDEYLAELDYIEVVEQMKEGYEEDIPQNLKKMSLEGKEAGDEGTEEEEESSEEESQTASKNELEDDDFEPASLVGIRVSQFSKRLRQRNRKKEENVAEDTKEVEKEKEEAKKEGERGSNDEDYITISDDDEVREPSSFAAAAGMGSDAFVSKYRSVRSLFGEDESCYIMDAKVQGNIGRYLNHSCSPNVFVQNVFVDTHDPRFPWVAFFALSHVRAGTELTWNYNYDVGSVPGKALYCYCGAANCRGRLL